MISQEIDESFYCLLVPRQNELGIFESSIRCCAFLMIFWKTNKRQPKSQDITGGESMSSSFLLLPLPVPFPTIVACLLPPLGRLLHPLFFMARRNSVFVWREAGKHEVCAE